LRAKRPKIPAPTPLVPVGPPRRALADAPPWFNRAQEDIWGAYDVVCTCHGKRVIAVPDEDACRKTPALRDALRALQEWQDDEDDYDSISRAERAMGA